MTATALPEQATTSTPRRTANRPVRMLVLNLVAVAAGLGVWALLSVVIGVQGLPGPAIGVLGLVMDRLLLLADRRLTSWQERR